MSELTPSQFIPLKEIDGAYDELVEKIEYVAKHHSMSGDDLLAYLAEMKKEAELLQEKLSESKTKFDKMHTTAMELGVELRTIKPNYKDVCRYVTTLEAGNKALELRVADYEKANTFLSDALERLEGDEKYFREMSNRLKDKLENLTQS